MKRILAIVAALLLSFSLKGQENRLFHVGIDTSVDCFLPAGNSITASAGLGVRARLGRYDQWVNLVSGVRYIYGKRLSGIQVPVLLNVNLVKGWPVSAYLGAGYEFDFIGTYCAESNVSCVRKRGLFVKRCQRHARKNLMCFSTQQPEHPFGIVIVQGLAQLFAIHPNYCVGSYQQLVRLQLITKRLCLCARYIKRNVSTFQVMGKRLVSMDVYGSKIYAHSGK